MCEFGKEIKDFIKKHEQTVSDLAKKINETTDISEEHFVNVMNGRDLKLLKKLANKMMNEEDEIPTMRWLLVVNFSMGNTMITRERIYRS